MLPEVSFAVHNTMVLPSGNVFDALFVSDTTLTLSEVVALPNWAVLSVRDVAFTLTSAGATIFGEVVSFTVTDCVAFALLPDASSTFQVMDVNPNGNCFGELFVIVTG